MSEQMMANEDAADGIEVEEDVLAVDESSDSAEGFDLSSPEGRYMARSKSFVSRARQLSDSLHHTWDAHAKEFVVEAPILSGNRPLSAVENSCSNLSVPPTRAAVPPNRTLPVPHLGRDAQIWSLLVPPSG